MKEISIDDIKRIDQSNMYKVIQDFPQQVAEAIEIGEKAPPLSNKSNDFLILGMGGSAIGGDILATYAANTDSLDHLRINVNRDYNIPGHLNPKTAVIASSYSGGTEETISALLKAVEITDNILCITTGGKLGDIADKESFTKVSIPGGLMPRCALGYSFFTMLKIVLKSTDLTNNAIDNINQSIQNTLKILEEKSKIYSLPQDDNPAYSIAKSLYNTVPVVYSSNILSAINMRWRAQFQENAKNLSFGNILPEMNHNEINSWSNPSRLLKDFSAILLVDGNDNDKIIKRINAVGEILTEKAVNVLKIESKADDYLARMFDLIYLGDWVSYFLAIYNQEDPTPIPLISKLKSLVAK